MENENFTPPEGVSLRIYKRIGMGFITLTVILLFVVMYMTLSRATIIVEPKGEPLNADLLVTVREENLKNGDITGRVGSVTVERQAFFTASGEGTSQPAKATGKVTIYSSHGANQTLISTTRLLSREGVLFRIKNTVVVPAGKSVMAEIYADKEGKGGEIGPTTFTIPGLNASLQQKIYAKSTAPTTGGMLAVSIIRQKDIDDAVQNIRSSLLTEGTERLSTLLNSDKAFTNIVFKDNIVRQETDIKVGERAEKFKLSIEMEVVGVAYGATLQDQAAKTLSGMIASDRKLISSNIMELKPTIERYDLDEKSASLKVNLSGQTVISDASPIFDKSKIAGLKAEEAQKYLEKYAGVSSVEIKFFPFWLKRVPKLRDHMRIIVK
jgi:hypothetical protein